MQSQMGGGRVIEWVRVDWEWTEMAEIGRKEGRDSSSLSLPQKHSWMNSVIVYCRQLSGLKIFCWKRKIGQFLPRRKLLFNPWRTVKNVLKPKWALVLSHISMVDMTRKKQQRLMEKMHRSQEEEKANCESEKDNVKWRLRGDQSENILWISSSGGVGNCLLGGRKGWKGGHEEWGVEREKEERGCEKKRWNKMEGISGRGDSGRGGRGGRSVRRTGDKISQFWTLHDVSLCAVKGWQNLTILQFVWCVSMMWRSDSIFQSSVVSSNCIY